MPLARVPNDLPEAMVFITPTIRNWYYIFDRHDRWEILAGSIRYCQQHKGLEVLAYIFMRNHVHLIIRAPDVAGVIRDFKRYTASELRKNIAATEPNVLDLFIDDDGCFVFWKKDNAPKVLETEAFFLQKLNYIHFNPVRKGYVEEPENWKWSSANPRSPIETVGIW